MPKNKNIPCPFCEFDKSTELFYHDRWKHITIARAPDSPDSKYRLLAVRTGIQSHKGMPTGEEREEVMVPLIAVAEAQVRNGKAGGYDIDEKARSILGHYHYQANLT